MTTLCIAFYESSLSTAGIVICGNRGLRWKTSWQNCHAAAEPLRIYNILFYADDCLCMREFTAGCWSFWEWLEELALPSTLAGPVCWYRLFYAEKPCFSFSERFWGIIYSLYYTLEPYFFFLFQGHFRHLLFCSLLHDILGWQYNPGYRRTLIKGKKMVNYVRLFPATCCPRVII